MTALMLMGAGLNAMLGIALLLLWRQDPRFPQVRQWGYSWILLSLGLTLGIALAPEQEPSWQHDLQALAASASLMGSLMLLIAGARSYRQLPFRQAQWLPAFLLMMASIVLLARLDHSLAVIAATVYLVAGSWACAWWMGKAAIPANALWRLASWPSASSMPAALCSTPWAARPSLTPWACSCRRPCPWA